MNNRTPEDFKIIGPTDEEIRAANDKRDTPRGLGKIIRALATSHLFRIAIAITFTAMGIALTYQSLFR